MHNKVRLTGIVSVLSLVCGLLAAPFLLSGFAAGPQEQAAAPAQVDTARLEVSEDLSESLANDMLDLSVAVRDREWDRIALYLPAQLAAQPFPSRPGAEETQVKWVAKHAWNRTESPAAGESPSISGSEFLQGWREFLEHFREIEDVRFKVKDARFDDAAQSVRSAKEPTAVVGAAGRARLAFYVIGRDAAGRREWARGTANVGMQYAENQHWQFAAFELLSLDSTLATKDLFSEVALPAGVHASRPAFGTPANSGFVWQGAAAADFDNDGWMDLFVAGSLHSFLYRNDGQSRFVDATEAAGLDRLDSGVQPLALDYDNDGDTDVFLSNVGAQVLLENRLVPDGVLRFRDVSLAAGVAVQGLGFSATAADVNGDGLPDIYVACYNHYGRIVPNSWFRATNGTPNLLFISQGPSKYKEQAAQWGVDDRRWSYAAAFADVNGDHRPDLYVANDFGENALYIHQGDRFTDQAAARGVLDPGNGMGVSFGDFNNDGRLDLHVTNMSSTAGNRILARLFPGSDPKSNVLVKLASGNNLYENIGAGTFRDVTAEAGGFSAGWAWGGGFLDFDNDGWEDLYTTNGFISGKSMKDT